MIQREVAGRYRGSIMGLAWSLVNPILMLSIYTFLFSMVFKARWGTDAENSQAGFAITLFVGLTIHGLFAEMLTRAPRLILSNTNYVKKVIFPLEILPIIGMGSALFHACIGFFILLVAILMINHNLAWTVLFLPFILIPFLIMLLGLTWFIASVGVFIRDIEQPIGALVNVLLFMSPVLYPLSALPQELQPWLMLNPITFIIEQSRDIIIFGKPPSWAGLGIYAASALFVGISGYWWFQKTRKGFADVM